MSENPTENSTDSAKVPPNEDPNRSAMEAAADPDDNRVYLGAQEPHTDTPAEASAPDLDDSDDGPEV
jgi:hypothetical protein